MEGIPRFQVGDTWLTLAEAKASALRFIVARGESWRSYKDSKNKHWVVICKARQETGCPFRIRINRCRDEWKLTIFTPHTCPALTHQNFRNAHSTTLIAGDPFYRQLIQQDPGLKAAAIRDHEWLRFGNRIPYLQAWRALEELKKDVLDFRAPPAGETMEEAAARDGGEAAPQLQLPQPSNEKPQPPQQQQLSTLEKIDPALLFATEQAGDNGSPAPTGWHLAEVTGTAPTPTAPVAQMGPALPAAPVRVPKKRGRKPKPKPVLEQQQTPLPEQQPHLQAPAEFQQPQLA